MIAKTTDMGHYTVIISAYRFKSTEILTKILLFPKDCAS